jgi:hypothetical protein
MRRSIAWAVIALAAVACSPPRDDVLPLGDSAADCAGCHVEQHDAFARSAHARSDRSPVLAAMLPRVEESWGAGARDRCESCHAPSHSTEDSAVTCISCHAAVGNRAERDGLLVIDPRPGLAGPFDDADADGAHATRASTLLASPSLCGTCHEVTGPALFVEPTLSEHLRSPAFADGEHCADCHMPELAAAPIARGAPQARRRLDHSFVGVDPPWGAEPADAALAAARTRELLASALVLRAALEPGSMLAVEIENVARGHDVPTGIASLRDIVVEATWVDREGARDVVRAIELGDRPMRGDEPVALPTDADRLERRRLAPGEIRRATLAIPGDAVAVDVVLLARAFRGEVLDALDLAALAREVPTHTLATETLALLPGTDD